MFLAGWHSHEELPEFFVAADAVISAAEREQFGQLLIEGMACGLPAIGIRALGPESIIEDGRSGWLVPAADESALAETIAEVTENPRERERRGRAARESVCARFSWTQISAQLAEILADAAASGRSRRRASTLPEPPPSRSERRSVAAERVARGGGSVKAVRASARNSAAAGV